MTIDIIMPCYYSNDIIKPALEKIAKQTIIKDITLIMVNDCSPNTSCEYQDLIKEYKNRIKIQYLKTDKNCGPGEARQLGLNNATSDFIMFQDDDDELYTTTSLENMIKSINNFDINNIISITGRIQFNYLNEKIENWQIIPQSLQGSLFNRKLLQQLNIHFEPILSFKEEDGCFSSLLALKSQSYMSLILDEIIYIRKRLNNHISITSRVNIIDSILAMIYLKCFPLLYLYENNIKDKILYYSYIEQAISFVPNLLQSLINNLQNNKYTLTIQQFNQLNFMLSIYNFIINYYNIDINNINLNNIKLINKNIFDNNSFYGNFNEKLIFNFKDQYLYQLLYIKDNFISN